ncbi:MAG TPA: hypothetical protein VMQ54_04270, partial [Steroidobacteraceae bacterium]|nr:hypothetical protein [Steroidobacteraceae bacterium]
SWPLIASRATLALNSAENRLRVLMVGRPLHRRIHLSSLSQEVGPPLGVQIWQTWIIRSNNVVSERAFVAFGFRADSVYGPSPTKFTTGDILAAVNQGSNSLSAVSIIADITNSGNTGTKNLTFFMKCAPSTEELQEPWSILYQGLTPITKSPQFIGPHATVQTNCAFPIDQLKAMNANSLFGYVMVDATYQDRLANDWHRTETTQKIAHVGFLPGVGPGGSATVGAAVSLVTYGRHNCADEECPTGDQPQ